MSVKTISLMFVCFVYLSSYSNLSCQLAIINDPDGYTNVRSGDSLNSKIIYRIYNDEVFDFELYENAEQSDWYPVTYLAYLDSIKDKSRITNPNENKYIDGRILEYGYMHKSRILPLEKLPKIKPSLVKKSILIIQNDSIRCEIKKSKFIKSKHKLNYSKEGDWIVGVDGKDFWWTDGGIPRNEIAYIKLTINNNDVEIPKEVFSDLYEPNLESIELHFRNDSTLFLIMYNSDAAGGYAAALVFKDKKFWKRFVIAGDC